MKLSILSICTLLLACQGCFEPERNCEEFKNGTFTFTTMMDGDSVTTTFYRKDSLEIDYFQGKADTSQVRWINPCEYVVKKLHPTSKAEEKSIHMKIISTSEDSYTFEYNIIGSSNRSRGTAYRKE